MEEIMKVDTVEQYNELFGFQTRHPQVSMVDFDKPESQGNYRMTVGFYGLFLKETKGCIINYGKSSYDFDDKTVVSFAPGQTVGYTRIEGMLPKSVGLLFHPDFIRGTSLGQKIKRYTFFSYEANEALHLSADERMVVHNCALCVGNLLVELVRDAVLFCRFQRLPVAGPLFAQHRMVAGQDAGSRHTPVCGGIRRHLYRLPPRHFPARVQR